MSVDLDEKLSQWLATVLRDLVKRHQKSSFVGKTQSGEINLIANIKKNHEGVFLSLLFISHSFRRGVRTICIPLGEDLSGWVEFCGSVSSVVLGVAIPTAAAPVPRSRQAVPLLW